jgi:hypothetical protein
MKKPLLACRRGWSPPGGAGEVVPIHRTADVWAAAMMRWMDAVRREASKAPLDRIRSQYTILRNVTATVDFIRKSFP